jgi:hypothetical protein
MLTRGRVFYWYAYLADIELVSNNPKETRMVAPHCGITAQPCTIEEFLCYIWAPMGKDTTRPTPPTTTADKNAWGISTVRPQTVAALFQYQELGEPGRDANVPQAASRSQQ